MKGRYGIEIRMLYMLCACVSQVGSLCGRKFEKGFGGLRMCCTSNNTFKKSVVPCDGDKAIHLCTCCWNHHHFLILILQSVSLPSLAEGCHQNRHILFGFLNLNPMQ